MNVLNISAMWVETQRVCNRATQLGLQARTLPLRREIHVYSHVVGIITFYVVALLLSLCELPAAVLKALLLFSFGIFYSWIMI